MYKGADIQDDRNKRSNIDELISTPWHAIQGGSPDFGGLYQLYDNNIEDMYSEKSASVKEAGTIEIVLNKLKNWWDTRKKKPEAVKKTEKNKNDEKGEVEKVSHDLRISDNPIQNAYWQGFAEKSAQAGVDPSELAEVMFRINGDLK